MKRIAIIGAGGFAREVAWLIRDINHRQQQYDFAGYVVSDVSKLGPHDSAAEVIGDLDWLTRNPVDCLAMGIGNPSAKLAIAADLDQRMASVQWPPLIHPTAQLDFETATIERGVVLCAGVIGTVNLTIREFAMVNLSCTIGHESILGRGVVLNPTVNISGGVTIEDGALIGTGAQILQYKTVGARAVVGAGAVVVRDVPADDTVTGVPAKSLQAQRPAEPAVRS
jgi:sugar O-acyltransferase (sialic acid O-acetyltransferase NeuD family)